MFHRYCKIPAVCYRGNSLMVESQRDKCDLTKFRITKEQ